MNINTLTTTRRCMYSTWKRRKYYKCITTNVSQCFTYDASFRNHEAQTKSFEHQKAAPTHSCRCCVKPLRPENTSYSGIHVFCSNKTPPYGRLWLRPCKSSMAASHYCPIKALGAMWAVHVTTNSSTVCCISSQHTMPWSNHQQIWTNNTTVENTQSL